MDAHQIDQDTPWLSVIMPTFNGERTIAEALNSISAQHDPRIEVIVVDDASMDSTAEIVRSFSGKLNLKVLPRGHTGNWVANTNWGIVNSSAPYLCFLHQDDRWEEGKLAAVRRVLAARPGLHMCFHPSFFIGPEGNRIGLWQSPFRQRGEFHVVPASALSRSLIIQNFIAICSPVFTRESACDVGLMDESLVYTADWDFWIKISAFGPVACITKPLSSFRVHAKSQTATLSHDADLLEAQLRCVLERHLCSFSQGTRDDESLLRVARFAIRANVALMRLRRGERSHLGALAWEFLKLGPAGWRRFFRFSRITDRVLARLRVAEGT